MTRTHRNRLAVLASSTLAAALAEADFDEIRIGTTFRSVAPIPEPATVGLIVLGGAMLLGRRGRGNHRDVGLHA